MALQPFFNNNNKRDDILPPRGGVTPNAAAVGAQPHGAQPLGGQQPVAAVAAATPASPVTREGESKLTVGPNIKLKGVEITDCDTLVVEGSVEATMDSRVIQISERGSFKGSADIDVAEIRGLFDGNLTARQKLVIYATGKVTGRVRYGKIVIEEGGQLSGEVESGTAQLALPGSAPRPGLVPVQ
jgi:cytoskeletal protein CcmA (bactofilin family)